MGISLLEQLRLIKDVIDNEHGGKVYDGYHYITPDWDLIDSGLAWQLQGHYGRTASALIDAGYCTERVTA